MSDIIFYTISIILVLIGILAVIGIIIENEYLCIASLILAYVIMLSAIFLLGVNYV